MGQFEGTETEIIRLIRNLLDKGELKRCHELGLDLDSIRQLAEINPFYLKGNRQSPLVTKITLDKKELNRLHKASIENREKGSVVNKLLRNGAGNVVLKELFSLSSSEISVKRKVMGLPISSGRKYVNAHIFDRTEKQVILDLLNSFFKSGSGCSKPGPVTIGNALLEISSLSGRPIDVVYKVLVDRNALGGVNW